MDLNITVKRKFTINGKEYGSLEEMPEDVRTKFNDVMGKLADSGHQADPTLQEKRIVFRAALGSDEAGTVSPAIDLPKPGSDGRREPGALGKVHSDRMSRPTKFESSFSPRILVVSVVLGVLLYLLYYLWHIRP